MDEPESLSEELLATADRLALSIPSAMARKLIAYGHLLLGWAKVINLTGATTLRELERRHFIDALAAAHVLTREGKLIDVGSGAGLPALPLAVLRPDLTLTLVEPTAKRVAFLRTAVRELELGARVTVVHGRVGPKEAISEGNWDAATARAVWSPPEWLINAQPLVRKQGQILVFCVSRSEAEEVSAGGTVVGYAPDRWLAVARADRRGP